MIKETDREVSGLKTGAMISSSPEGNIIMQEQVYNMLYHIIANGIVYFIQMAVIEYAMESRFSHIKTVLIEVSSYLIYVLIMYRTPYLTIGRALLGNLLIFAVVYPLHKEKWYYALLIVTLTSIMNVFADAFLAAMIPPEMIVSGVLFNKYPLTAYSIYICLVAFLQMLFVLAVRMFRRRYDSLHDRIPWLLFAVFPISQLIILVGVFRNYSADETLWSPANVIPSLIVCVIADIALYFAVRMVSDRTELRVRNDLLEDQLADQQSYYRELSSSFEEIRKMRHDIANHLYTMKALITEGKTDEAEDYANDVMKEDKAVLRFPSCENTVIASYLARKADDYQNKKIAFDTEIILPSELNIPNSDLICIFGNILDNAEEACSRTAEPKIILKTQYRAPYLTIYAQNPMDSDDTKRTRRIPELERGLGTRIIQSTAEKYDGDYTVTRVNNTYSIEVILKNKTEE